MKQATPRCDTENRRSSRGLCFAIVAASAIYTMPVIAEPREVPQIPLKVSANRLEALFEEIMVKTGKREAFSEVKESTMSFSPLADMEAVRDEFVSAESEADLYYALIKLSNARRDRHLRVITVDDGLNAPDAPDVTAPVRVLPDYSDLDNPSFFIAKVGRGLSSPGVGDRIVEINGRSMSEYIDEFTHWISHSTYHGLYWQMARYMPRIRSDVPLNLYSDKLNLTLERRTGERYSVSLAYGDRSTHSVDVSHPGYAGFVRVMRRASFDVYVDWSRETILFRWWRFSRDALIDDINDLMVVAEQREWLDYDMIIDVTFSGGGSWGAFVIQRLVDRPFRTTFGNVRVSDAGRDLIRYYQGIRVGEDERDVFGIDLSRRWLRDWARTDGVRAVNRGEEYTPSVPFKLAHLPKDSDGIMHPAPVRFRGKIVIINGSSGGGSHLDQFVAMFADNDLATIVGLPTGGFSNTWEDLETLRIGNRPMVRFMWSIGHTIRPNGEVLEGNPAWPDVYVPITPENFRSYHENLLREAFLAFTRVPGREVEVTRSAQGDRNGVATHEGDGGLRHYSLEEMDELSSRKGQKSAIVFVNRIQDEISLYWLDDDGDEFHRGALGAGESMTVQTFEVRVWIVKNRRGDVLGAFQAQSETGEAVIPSTVTTRPRATRSLD